MRRHPVRPLVVGTVTLAFLLGACSTGPTGDSGGAAAQQDDAATDTSTEGEAGATGADEAFPVTIEHAFGQTTVEDDPQRIATVGWSDHDIVVALGEVPVGATQITWGGNDNGSTDWFDEAVAGAGDAEITRYSDADGIPADEIAAVEPDLILGTNSGLTQEDYDTLSQIAPVVAYPEVAWGTPWRDSVRTVARAIGRETEAEDVLAETEAALERARSEYGALDGLTQAWTWFTPTDLSTIGVYTTLDLRPQFMEEFGLEHAPAVTELTEANAGSFSANLSAEQADTLDADLVFLYVDDPSLVETLVDHDLVGQVPALASGSFVAIDDMAVMNAITTPTPLSIPVVLQELLPLAAEAAEKAR